MSVLEPPAGDGQVLPINHVIAALGGNIGRCIPTAERCTSLRGQHQLLAGSTKTAIEDSRANSSLSYVEVEGSHTQKHRQEKANRHR